MTSHTGRLYGLAVALVVFFLTWASIAAHPWVQAKPDPRLAALAAREQQLRRESVAVRHVVQLRWAAYRVQLRHRQSQLAANRSSTALAVAAPAVRVVTLPPLTVTRTS